MGLGNYVELFGTTRFVHATINTLLYVGGKLVLQIPLAQGLAMLLNQSLPGTRIVRGAVFAALGGL